MTPSDGRDAELALANRIEHIEPVELKTATGEFANKCIIAATISERDKIVSAIRRSPVDNPSREELISGIGHSLAGHSFALIHGGHHEEVASKIVGSILARLSANPPDPDSMNDKRAGAVDAGVRK